MDFSSIFQLRTKKFWWMDVIFYFVISVLVATILCYLIFLMKNGLQREGINKAEEALLTVGTPQQKEYEQTVIDYQGKIKTFTDLLKNHEFTSNVFAFMQSQTMPNAWFKQFNLDAKNSSVQLSGETDDMDMFSRQVAVFEKNEYIASIDSLNSSLGESAKTNFNTKLTMAPDIFSYLAKTALQEEVEEPVEGEENQPSQENVPEEENVQETPPIASNEKLITAFHLLLKPEVIGIIDQTNYKINLIVPAGTALNNLSTSLVISPGATVVPASGAVQNFTDPVIYKITAQDGSTQDYEVRVTANVPLQASNSKTKTGGSAIFVVVIFLVIVAAVVAAVIIVLKKRKDNKANFNLSN